MIADLGDGVLGRDRLGVRCVLSAAAAGTFADTGDEAAGEVADQPAYGRRAQEPAQEQITLVLGVHLVAVLHAHGISA